MTVLVFLMLIILVVGMVCLGFAVRSSLKERSFRRYAELHDAEITGYTQDADDRYKTLYKIELDGREVHGVFPDSIPEPIMRVGEVVSLYVRPSNPTEVFPAVAQKQTTVRIFNYLIGTLMLLTSIPLLVLLLF